MIHWEECDELPVWQRYVECSHWGLILTAVLPRWNLFLPTWDMGGPIG